MSISVSTPVKSGTELRSTALVAFGLLGTIVMMIVPAPPLLLDIGLTISFALAILILTVTLFIERPLDFSSFPALLLGSLMLRLSLNVSSTRLIIGEGHTGPEAAGSVINGFAMFIMGNNIFLGLVVFCVLLIVNFMVITKGAGRMAEVGARFALDGMPGKQLAIDSDVAAGAISHADAKERRRIELEETNFFGSLDGASKFVKGDAIAGLLITLLNLVVGLGVGLIVHGLTFEQAIATYAVLTVGDGLVSQIPAVIISVAAALLLSKGGASGAVDRAILHQLGSHPAAIATVGVVMGVFAFMPGLPFGLFFLGALGLCGTAFFLRSGKAVHEQGISEGIAATAAVTRPLGDVIDVDEIHLEFAADLIPLALDRAQGLEERIGKIRSYVAAEFGFIVPPVRLTDNRSLELGQYIFRVQTVEAARDRLRVGYALVIADSLDQIEIDGEDVREPVYGAPARWIAHERSADAMAAGATVVEPIEVLSTHILEIIKQNFGRLMNRRAVRRILDEYVKTSDPERAAANRRLIEEFVPEKVPVEAVQAVFRLLLEELVSIRNVPLILEAIAEARVHTTSNEQIAEFVRQRLNRQITAPLRDEDGRLPLIQIATQWEEAFTRYEISRDGRVDVALPPEEFNRLAKSIGEQIALASSRRSNPSIVTFANRRRFLKALVQAKGLRASVLSYDEIDPAVRPLLVGTA